MRWWMRLRLMRWWMRLRRHDYHDLNNSCNLNKHHMRRIAIVRHVHGHVRQHFVIHLFRRAQYGISPGVLL